MRGFHGGEWRLWWVVLASSSIGVCFALCVGFCLAFVHTVAQADAYPGEERAWTRAWRAGSIGRWGIGTEASASALLVFSFVHVADLHPYHFNRIYNLHTAVIPPRIRIGYVRV